MIFQPLDLSLTSPALFVALQSQVRSSSPSPSPLLDLGLTSFLSDPFVFKASPMPSRSPRSASMPKSTSPGGRSVSTQTTSTDTGFSRPPCRPSSGQFEPPAPYPLIPPHSHPCSASFFSRTTGEHEYSKYGSVQPSLFEQRRNQTNSDPPPPFRSLALQIPKTHRRPLHRHPAARCHVARRPHRAPQGVGHGVRVRHPRRPSRVGTLLVSFASLTPSFSPLSPCDAKSRRNVDEN